MNLTTDKPSEAETPPLRRPTALEWILTIVIAHLGTLIILLRRVPASSR
jgi:hypothetical protein